LQKYQPAALALALAALNLRNSQTLFKHRLKKKDFRNTILTGYSNGK
jgi:hypothetical protein